MYAEPPQQQQSVGYVSSGMQVEAAARAQQERLAAAFPDASETPSTGGPTPLQWGLACVRSRAFQLSATRFAYVPFLDLANHAFSPTAGYRPAPENEPPAVELVATEDIKAGQEVTISYTGPQGATNRRLLVQYGFVQADNPGDRLDLGLCEGYIGTAPLRSNPCALPVAVADPVEIADSWSLAIGSSRSLVCTHYTRS